MMASPKTIESAKNVLIVVLFLTTILLLYLLWENLTMQTFRLSDIMAAEVSEVPAAQDVTLPEEIVVAFGSGVYTSVGASEYGAWDSCMGEFAQFTQSANVLAEEISGEQYRELRNYRSVFCRFSYSLPFGQFCEAYNIKTTKSFSQIGSFNEIGYSAGSPESFFVGDAQNGKYYRLISDQKTDNLDALIGRIEQGGYTAYYMAGTYFGGFNTAVLPVSLSSKLAEQEVLSELNGSESEKIRAFAEPFFGEGFDFVRRIEESKGNLVFMYGYGQKVLTFYTDGSVEYKEEQTSSTSGQQSYFEALQTALEFVGSHGGWTDPGGGALDIYIRNAGEVESDKKKGFRFVFGVDVQQAALYYEEGQAVVVEVYNGQVTYYKRDLSILPEGAPESLDQAQEAFSAVNLIAQNHGEIYRALQQMGLLDPTEVSQEVSFNWVTENLDRMEAGYVRGEKAASGESSLSAAWILTIENMDFYFDLFSGQPMGDNSRNGR